jgi:hypothetical protein
MDLILIPDQMMNSLSSNPLNTKVGSGWIEEEIEMNADATNIYIRSY